MKSITQVVEDLIKPYIDSHDRAAEAIIAPVETDATSASDDYAVGKQLILNNVLYDVIAPITTGDALVVNTNIKASDNVSSDIEALTNNLSDEVEVRAKLGAHNLVDIDGFTLIKSSARTKYIYPSDIIHGAIPSEQVVISFKVTNSNLSKSDNYFKAYGSNGEIGAVSFKANGRYSFVFDGASFNNFYIFISSNAESDETCTISEIMITLATDAYSEYTPYAMTNQELTAENQTLTNKVAEESAIRDVLGAKNILPNKLVSGTYYGVSFVNNGDGTITANGTYSEVNAVLLSNGWSDTDISWITPFIGKKIRLKSGVVGLTFALRFYDSSHTEISTIESRYNGTWGEGTVPSNIHHYAAYLFPSGTITLTDALIFPRVDYEPYAMTNREMTPYVQAISNPNLLDNPWFTVNQRGQSSYSGTAGYSYDRWYRQQSGITVSLDSDECIVIQNTDSNYSNFKQVFSAELIKAINGRTLTLSVLFKDGTIESATSQNIDLSQNASYCSIRLADGTNANIRSTNISNVSLQIAVKGNITIPAIRAFKLELGSVSTLAMDTAPNYATELLKCQRYFERVGGSTYEIFGVGFYVSATNLETNIKVSPKRSNPTITLNGTVYCWDDDNQGASAHQSTALQSGANCSLDGRAFVSFVTSGATKGKTGFVQFRDTTSYLDFSADL